MPSRTPSALPITSDITQHIGATLSSPTSRSGAISHALRAPSHLCHHPAPRLDAAPANVEL
eukprot:1114959-Rhodomonas_salina.1